MKRKFISIYFPYRAKDGELQRKTVSVAFNKDEGDLYDKVKDISTTEIKKLIAIFSFTHLTKRAKKEERKLSDLIKTRLKHRLSESDTNKITTIKYNSDQMQNWVADLEENKVDQALIDFLKDIIKTG